MPNKITHEINDVMIFETGTWNGDSYTEDDFDGIVKAFEEIGSFIKPPVKLGHARNQTLLQENGYPAAGFITGLRRKGAGLYADFSAVPNKVKQLIDLKAYGRFSPEILWDYTSPVNKKLYKYALRGVALMGADVPACQTMDDFINLYSLDEEKKQELEIYYYSDTDTNFKFYSHDQKDQKNQLRGNTMNEQEYQEKIKKLEAEKEQDKASIKNYEEKNKTLEKKYNELNKKSSQSDMSAFFDKYKEKITPVQRNYYEALIQRDTMNVKEYSFEAEGKTIKVELDTLSILGNILDNMPKFVEYKEQTKKNEKHKEYSAADDNDGEQLDKMAKEYAEKHNVSYRDAVVIVSKEITNKE